MTIRDAPKCDEQDLEERLRIAREFKVKTYGKELTSDIFGETTSKYVRPPRPKSPKARVRSKEYQKQWQINHRITEARRKQALQGGTFGVTMCRHAAKGVTKFRAHVGNTVVFYCAVDAAIHRNDVMNMKYPGIPEFQVDMNAVWDKWGCSCGKHERGSR